MKKITALATAIFMSLSSMLAQEYQEVWIYPDGNFPEVNGHENDEPKQKNNWTAQPYMHIYRADTQNNSGRTVVCLPGGGYSHLSLVNEGSDWAPYFRNLGINFVVLAYRMPYGHDQIPQTDVYDGFRYLKAHASELGINPNDIGIMGFSAGGHLASTVATHAPKEVRPSFQILFYPVVSMDTLVTHRGSHDNLIGRYACDSLVQLYSNEKQIDELTPPAILLMADDDKAVPTPNGVNYYLSMREHGIPATLHVYPSGGHGFGFKSSFAYHDAMLQDLADWLQLGIKGDFTLGADISWCTWQEAIGEKYYNFEGRERDAFTLTREMGMDAVRLRVWVDPKGPDGSSWCGKQDVLQKALRAKKAGLDIMIDFHYSDSWADPAKQPIPAAWKKHSYKKVCEDVRQHTIEVLQLLKDNGITPKWVQVGNETSNGMIWPVGDIRKKPAQYAGLFKSGYEATKEVFPEAIVIAHLDNGWKDSLYDWNLGILRDNGAKWDMIGMSLYPYWAQQSDSTLTDQWVIDHCIANIRRCAEKFGTDVMITEIGFEVDDEHPEKMHKGYLQLSEVIRRARYETNGRCRGVMYWEPYCRNGYKLGAYYKNGMPTEIMKAWKSR